MKKNLIINLRVGSRFLKKIPEEILFKKNMPYNNSIIEQFIFIFQYVECFTVSVDSGKVDFFNKKDISIVESKDFYVNYFDELISKLSSTELIDTDKISVSQRIRGLDVVMDIPAYIVLVMIDNYVLSIYKMIGYSLSMNKLENKIPKFLL